MYEEDLKAQQSEKRAVALLNSAVAPLTQTKILDVNGCSEPLEKAGGSKVRVAKPGSLSKVQSRLRQEQWSY